MEILDLIYPALLVLSASVCSLVINKVAAAILKLFSRWTGLGKVADHVNGKLGIDDPAKPRKRSGQ